MDLVVEDGRTTCAEALKAIRDYRASPARRTASGFTTVDGWRCSHDSITWTYEGCAKSDVAVNTISSQSSAPAGTPT
jgi:hypothetical protein